MISEDFPYLTIARDYEQAGADAISVLTEPEFFKGSDRYLTEISDLVRIPVLRKDFIVDEYQIYEAKVIGADAILLICSLLDTDTVKKFLRLSNELGLSALVEAHTKEELFSAIDAGARVIGVNNRNLQTFEVDLKNSIELRGLVPMDIIFVAESGIKTPEDIAALKAAQVDAVLIGETLMRSNNKREQLSYLRGNLTLKL
jgi:indole-3-glycerol phosphate synthase